MGYSENNLNVEIILLRNCLELSSFFSRELLHKDVCEDPFHVTKYRVWDVESKAKGALAHFLTGSRSKETFGVSQVPQIWPYDSGNLCGTASPSGYTGHMCFLQQLWHWNHPHCCLGLLKLLSHSWKTRKEINFVMWQDGYNFDVILKMPAGLPALETEKS